MEFGRLSEIALDTIDLSLPKEPAFNEALLSGRPFEHPKVYIGCAKWGRKEWIGKIYPLKTKEKDLLDEYVHHYNSIELNATHYKVYNADTIKKWSAKADRHDFLFCPKMFKGITHSGSLLDKEAISSEFLKGIRAFEKHLGPIFIQLSENFSSSRQEELYSYLKSLPTDLQFFVEVRHPDLFAKKRTAEELFATLKELKIGAVITDTAGRRDCAHMYLTVPKVFIRYVGNSLHPSDHTRIDAWVDRIKYWLDNGLEELYFFMHMHDEATSPELTVYLVDRLNKACKLDLLKPVFIPVQPTLF